MKIEELDENSLRIFLKTIPEKTIRTPFSKYSKLKTKIKGFRVETCDINKLINISIEAIKKDEVFEFCRNLNNISECYLSAYKKRVKELSDNGYPEMYAEGQTIIDLLKKEFRPVFYLLADFDENKTKSIDETIKMLTFLNTRFALKDDGSFDNKLTNLETSIQEKMDAFNDGTCQKIKDVDNRLASTENKINTICECMQRYEDVLEKKETLIRNEIEALKAENESRINKFEIEQNENISNNIKTLSEMLKRTTKAKESDWEHLIFEQQIYFDGDKETIEDIETLEDAIFDTFNESNDVNSLLTEVILGSKLILACGKKANLLANKLSWIVSGGKLNEVILADGDYLKEFEMFLKQLSNERTSVTIVSGAFSKTNYYDLIKLVSKLGRKHKFIFEIAYAEQIRYLPPRIIDDFYFFDREMQKENNLESAYIINISEETKGGEELAKVLKKLGCLTEIETYSEKYVGILCHDIIPFLHFNEGTEYEEILERMKDCKEFEECRRIVLHD